MRLARITARESAELRRRHAHRPAALERIFQPDQRLAPERVRLRVERLHAFDLEHRADLQVVLQVLADPRQRVLHADAVLLKQRRRPDA